MKFLLSLLVACLSVSFINAKAPIKYGKVSEDLFSMTTYDKDTSASAVILCDYGKFYPNQFEFKRTLRIKILKKDGLHLANWTFPAKEDAMVRGKTFNLVNGEIEETKLDNKKDVHRERVTENRYQLKVAMPSVKVGSVIDLEITTFSLPSVWYFQYTIPVIHSELIIYQHEYIQFSKHYYGFEYLDINEANRWVMTDVPAFKTEKYMNSSKNYRAKFDIEIARITHPSFFRNYATDWTSIHRSLNESNNFGKRLKSNKFLDDIAAEINAKGLSDEEKIKAAVNKIKEVKWNGKKQLFCSSFTLKSRYENKLASSAELNIMLIYLLRALGMETEPFVLSTRDHGILSMLNPSIKRLNYVLAQVTLGENTLLLDATDKYLDPLLIPHYCLNYYGRVVGKTANKGGEIIPPANHSKRLMYKLAMDSTGKISGNLVVKNIDYAARNKRRQYHSFSSKEDFIIDFEKRNPTFTVENCDFTGLDDNTKPVMEKYDITIATSGNIIGSKLLLNPLFEEQITETPFKQETRLFPIDFTYPINSILVLQLQLPANANVEELPESVTMTLPDRSISFTYNIELKGNVIQLMYKMKIDKSIYTEDKYPEVKQLYAELVKRHAKNILINLQ